MAYSFVFPKAKEEQELLAKARLEDVEASYKDLSQVCARIRGKPVDWALKFLEQASEGEIPVLYSTFNKRLGHRGEIGGRKGRYPVKAARIVYKVLKSAISNGSIVGLADPLRIAHAAANKKHSYPRMSPKGRRSRQSYETARIEIVVQAKERKLDTKVEVRKPEKAAAEKAESKKENAPAHPTAPHTPPSPSKSAPVEHKTHETKPAAHHPAHSTEHKLHSTDHKPPTEHAESKTHHAKQV